MDKTDGDRSEPAPDASCEPRLITDVRLRYISLDPLPNAFGEAVVVIDEPNP